MSYLYMNKLHCQYIKVKAKTQTSQIFSQMVRASERVIHNIIYRLVLKFYHFWTQRTDNIEQLYGP
jgi:hypothetical protein